MLLESSVTKRRVSDRKTEQERSSLLKTKWSGALELLPDLWSTASSQAQEGLNRQAQPPLSVYLSDL